MDELCARVVSEKADIGIAFDGDADRMLAVDENGKLVDGDQIMAICGNFLKENGKLAKDTIVVTVMTNLGFSLMGEKQGIHVEKTKVGDRYVLENMLENGYNLGGEQSGHVIFLDDNTTGDGLLSALHLLQVMVETKRNYQNLHRSWRCCHRHWSMQKCRTIKKKVTWNIQKLQRQSVNWRKICRRRKGSNPSIWYRTIGSCHDRRQKSGSDSAGSKAVS